MEINLEKLKDAFLPKWRVQSAKNGKAICVPYIDARDVQTRLDQVVGAANWQNTYDAESGVSSLGIKIEGEWIWKSDIGKAGAIEADKSKASDALKRAAVLWGIGRHIYDIDTRVLDAEGSYPVTAAKQKLYTGDQLTRYLNGVTESESLLMQIVKQNSHLNANQEYQDCIKKLLAFLKTK